MFAGVVNRLPGTQELRSRKTPAILALAPIFATTSHSTISIALSSHRSASTGMTAGVSAASGKERAR
jgi:hypothetical protein